MATKILTKAGLDIFWNKVKSKISSDISGGTALKVSKALTFGSKSYDGSEEKEITASDLGALTSINFSDLPDIYWADVKASDTSSKITTPSFSSIDVSGNIKVGSTNTPGNQYSLVALTSRNNVDPRLVLSSTTPSTYQIASFYKSGYTKFRELSFFDAETDLPNLSSNPALTNIFSYDTTNHAFRLRGNLYVDGAITSDSINDLVEITWSDLKALRDNSQLVPGRQYRIIDYHTTVAQLITDARSADHQFDIIVTADSSNKLNERARAIAHSGDTYFSSNEANLEAWELKYCLDNDADRFEWAKDEIPNGISCSSGLGTRYYDNTTMDINGTTYYGFGEFMEEDEILCTSSNPSVGDTVYLYNTTTGTLRNNNITVLDTIPAQTAGQGVIYWMKDEYNNECHYDFKNIQFKVGAKTQPGTIADVYYYTFSLVSGTDDATVNDYTFNGGRCFGNKIDFCDSLKRKLNYIVFRNISAYNDCSFNVFGKNCRYNTFGHKCYSNSFEESCSNNTFGFECAENTFHKHCYNNVFGNMFLYNTIDQYSHHVSFGSYCEYNTIGKHCTYITIGDYCERNTVGRDCNYIYFGDGSTTKNFYLLIAIEDGNEHIKLNCTATTSSTSSFRNVKVSRGVNNTSSWKTITDANSGQTYQTVYQPANSQTINI